MRKQQKHKRTVQFTTNAGIAHAISFQSSSIYRPVASNFSGEVLFEENVDLILQQSKVQEQLKSLCSVCIAHIHEGIQKTIPYINEI